MQSLFTQNVIAVVWDFDKTLTPGYMQTPLFKHYGVDERTFWNESNSLLAFYQDQGLYHVSPDSLYLNYILTYVQCGVFQGLSNRMLFDLGKQIQFFPGLPTFFEEIKQTISSKAEYAKHEISVEHYIVSTGLRQMIMGSAIAPYIDGVWACEFIERTAKPGYLQKHIGEILECPSEPVLCGIGYVIDNTTKTRALFEINKGTNKHTQIDVNACLAHEDRRIPFSNMVYIADGPSDIPAFSIVNQYGGRTLAVYTPQSMQHFSQVDKLQKDNRVQGIGEANYIAGSLTAMWILKSVTEIADRIVKTREMALEERVGTVPRHIINEVSEKVSVQKVTHLAPTQDAGAVSS